MIDPIADLLTRVRNALAVKKSDVHIPYSRIKFAIAKILQDGKWVESVEKVDVGYGQIKIVLRYEDEEPAIKVLKRISKPGRRIYVDKENLPRVLNNFGIAILSTSHGVMTNHEARKIGVGGEVLCEIY